MKFIIAPDKFKGSLTSLEVCSAISDGLRLAIDSAEVAIFPMADGGDGFAEVMKYYTNTTTQQLLSVDPLGREIHCSYELNTASQNAIIELATCSGLALLKHDERNPMLTSTFGSGLQIRDAIDKGIKTITLGIGGSATNDAGIGILNALQFTFLDENRQPLPPCGQSLIHIKEIILPDPLPDVEFVIACDVDNPLYGKQGAAAIFSPQKGATPEQVEFLDEGLRNFAGVILKQTGKDISSFPGAGAAGGIAAGLLAFLPVKVIEGTNLILSASNIENSLDNVDMIITGEGRIDEQTFRGKTVSAICALGARKNIRTIAFCGKLDLSDDAYKKLGLELAEEISIAGMPEHESMKHAYQLLLQRSRVVIESLSDSF